jgi:hypothetical protein
MTAHKVTSFNIILLGQGLPIRQLRTDDLDFGNTKAQDVIRLPIALEIRADPFQVVGTPERFQISCSTAPTPELVDVAKRNAEALVAVSGQRAFTAVGHNLIAEIPDRAAVARVRDELLSDDLLTSVVGLALEPSFILTRPFRFGDASISQVEIAGNPESGLVLQFNYHFDLEKNLKTQRPALAIQRADASVEHATKTAAALMEAVDSAQVGA